MSYRRQAIKIATRVGRLPTWYVFWQFSLNSYYHQSINHTKIDRR